MRLVVNLWHLKNTNGMYWYAMDYVRGLDNVEAVIVRGDSLGRVEQDLRGLTVLRLSLFSYLLAYLKFLFCRQYFLYTPTPHPLPFLSRQMVVLHDPYPFLVGRLSRIKCWLFFFGASSSGTIIGVVNRSAAANFVSRLMRNNKIIDSPNCIGEPLVLRQRAGRGDLTIGLLGADSSKKRYEELFNAFRERPVRDVSFMVYGHKTAYLKEVLAEYRDVPVKIAHSDDVSLHAFFESVDAIVSVSKGEGFSRLVALAVTSGVPIFLTNDPVYEEFYGGTTALYETPEDLLEAISKTIFDRAERRCPLAFSGTIDYCSKHFLRTCRYLNTLSSMARV